jgi:asparagine synthase (glutamine-hydrolysing)
MTTNADAVRMASLLTTERLEFSPLSILNHEQRRKLNTETDPFLSFKKCDSRFNEFDEVRKMLLTDIMLQLPSQFLAKVDRSTMACGIEARVPLLDENVLKLAINMPTKYFFKGLKGKYVLRESLRGRLPNDIIDAPKQGFGVPYKKWLKGPLSDFARDAILDEQFLIRFGFERYKLEDLIYKHRIGVEDNGFTLWKILQLALWSGLN